MKKIGEIKFVIREMYKNMFMKDKRLFIWILIYMFTFPVYELSLAYFPKILLDRYINNEPSEIILKVILAYLVVGCVFGVVNCVIKETAIARIGFLRIDYLAAAFNKIITSDYKNMEDSTFFNKYDSAFDACSNAESGIEKVYNILFDLPALIVKIILISYVICRFSFVILLVVIIHVIVSFKIKQKSASYKYIYREDFSKINRKKRYFNNVTQDFQYGKDIRLYNFKNLLSEKYSFAIMRYKKLFSKVKNKECRLNLVSGITMLACDLAVYGALIFGAKGRLSISDITLYFIVVTMLISSMNLFIKHISDVYGEGLYIKDYYNFINADLCEKRGREVILEKNAAEIWIKNLSFKYPHTDRYVIKNLDLHIKPGERVALVGDNGVGKSTLIKILVGLFRDFEGKIFIDGKDVDTMSAKSLFSAFSVVFQDINLLAYTVKENITGTGKACDSEKVWEVVEKVGMKKKIEKAEKGLDQQVHKYMDQKGLEFSGGESQKIAIARALYKNAGIFILDEPTASLDALAEKLIYEKFGEITNGKTTIFISHRLASTKFCDRIILVGSDGVLEEGTHRELMERKGKYFEMFSIQSRYYQENNDEEDETVY